MSPITVGMIILAGIGLLVLGPLVTIWALNLLFSLAIPYSLATWAAVAWLGILISGSRYSS